MGNVNKRLSTQICTFQSRANMAWVLCCGTCNPLDPVSTHRESTISPCNWSFFVCVCDYIYASICSYVTGYLHTDTILTLPGGVKVWLSFAWNHCNDTPAGFTHNFPATWRLRITTASEEVSLDFLCLTPEGLICPTEMVETPWYPKMRWFHQHPWCQRGTTLVSQL